MTNDNIFNVRAVVSPKRKDNLDDYSDSTGLKWKFVPITETFEKRLTDANN